MYLSSVLTTIRGWGWLRSFLGGEDATRVLLVLFIHVFASHVVGSKFVMGRLNVLSFIEMPSKNSRPF